MSGGAGAPEAEEGGDGKEEAPGKEPDEMEGPEEISGELVVVHGDALAQEAEEVLVDEVEPEEAVTVGSAGVAEAGEDVPRGGDGEEEEDSGEGFQPAPMLCFSGQEEIGEGGSEEEHESDEALGEDGEGETGPHGAGIEDGVRREAFGFSQRRGEGRCEWGVRRIWIGCFQRLEE